MGKVLKFKPAIKYCLGIMIFIFICLESNKSFAQCTALIAHQTPEQLENPGTFTFWVTDESGQVVDAIYKWQVVVNSVLQDAPGFNEGPYYTTGTVNETTGYQLTATVSFGCLQQIAFSAMITPIIPTAPPVPNHVERCGPGAVVASVQALPNFFYEWYDGVSGAKLTPGIDGTLSTGQSYTIGGTGNSELHIPFTTSSILLYVTGVDIYYPQGGASGTNVNVTINPIPVVSISDLASVYCRNSTPVPLIGTPVGGSWTVDGQSVGSFIPDQFTGNANHVVKYSYTSERGCTGSDQKTVFIRNVPPPPVTQNVTIMYDNSVTLSADGPDPLYTYRWYTAQNEPITVSPSYTTPLLRSTTSYRLEVIDTSTGCASNSKTTIIVYVEDAQNHNFIRDNVIAVRGIMNQDDIPPLEIGKRNEKTDYFDGLGRPMQGVITQGSPLKKDIVQPIVYDAFGRETVKYLPYVPNDNTGWYKANPIGTSPAAYTNSPQHLFYNSGSGGKMITDAIPYSKTIFEASPLNRVLQLGATGTGWQPDEGNPNSTSAKVIKNRYLINQSNEVYYFIYNQSTGSIAPGNGTYYAESTLFANKTYDESNQIVLEYVDKSGKTVCKKVQSGGTIEAPEFASTYYIYDDFGNLVLVIPPEGVEKVKTALNLTDPAQ